MRLNTLQRRLIVRIIIFILISRPNALQIKKDEFQIFQFFFDSIHMYVFSCFVVGRFERYKRENHIRYVMPDVPSSDEEESEDEDYMDFIHYA